MRSGFARVEEGELWGAEPSECPMGHEASASSGALIGAARDQKTQDSQHMPTQPRGSAPDVSLYLRLPHLERKVRFRFRFLKTSGSGSGFSVWKNRRSVKGAGGKGPRQKTSNIVKKCQRVFPHFSTFFAQGKKKSKIVKKC